MTCLYICFSKGKFPFEIISSFSETSLTLSKLFLRQSVLGELAHYPITPRQSKHRGKMPGLPVMLTFGALSVPVCDLKLPLTSCTRPRLLRL